MEIVFSRPIVFFDLETTGTNISTDRIVEISLCKVFPELQEELFTFRVNPQMPIPAEASAVHGIYDKDVANEKTFEQLADALLAILRDCDLGGYNIHRFDLPVLRAELGRAKKFLNLNDVLIFDPFVIYQRKEPRNLSAAYRYYCNKELTNAHSAEADILATKEVFFSQLTQYNDIGNNPAEIAKQSGQRKLADIAGKFTFNEKDELVYDFGKNKGQIVEDDSYVKWLLTSDFPEETKQFLKEYLRKE